MLISKPHKAENADLEKLIYPAIVMPKIDGVRGLQLIRGLFTGRTLKEFRNEHLTRTFSDQLLYGFDGEIAKGNITDPHLCNTTTGWCNSHSHKTDGLCPDWYVFDIVSPDVAHLPYRSRWDLVRAAVDRLHDESVYGKKYSHVKYVPEWYEVNSLEEVLALHSDFVARGFEGTIIRRANAPHKNGRSTVREGYYMRIKDFADEEVTVIELIEAQTNLNEAVRNPLGYLERSSAKDGKVGNGMIGALIVRRSNGDLVTMGPGKLTHAERVEFWNAQDLLKGKTVKMRHMPHGAKDKPRFPAYAGLRIEPDL